MLFNDDLKTKLLSIQGYDGNGKREERHVILCLPYASLKFEKLFLYLSTDTNFYFLSTHAIKSSF